MSDDFYDPRHAKDPADQDPDRRDPQAVIPHQEGCPPHQPVKVGTEMRCRLCNQPA